jgi:aminoglycoside phosphotransferase family enzyme/predicted kinase
MLAEPAARDAFLAAMQTPEPYAALHPVQAPVVLVQTHVSWVFLAGAFAYKVKKPLRLGFLDYSTPDRREALCREELRLNLRHAPDLYLDVVPISGSPAAPRIGGTGHAFEHALRMRRFASHDELDVRLARGTVDPPELAQFGAELARVHAAAAPAPQASDYGAPGRVHRYTLDNFAEIRAALPPAAAAVAALARMQASLDSTFARIRAVLEQRRATGFVRECHGDLHCGNVTRWNGRLLGFDALEFDPALRFIDVASDLAFLSMDLAARGRADLRRALLDAWCEASGDYDAVRALPYFEAYRALVRAKVSALRARQAGGDAEEANRDVHRYLDWEREHAACAPPMLVVMTGLSGSGKTWLAQKIATACLALHVRSDVERKRLAGLGPLERSESPPDAGLYSPQFGERTYARLRECAAACLQGGESVVIDAASLRRHERAAFVGIATDNGAVARIVHCAAPLAVLKARVAQRQASGADPSEATVDLLDRQPSYWEALTADEQRIALRVDTADDPAVERLLGDLCRLKRSRPARSRADRRPRRPS